MTLRWVGGLSLTVVMATSLGYFGCVGDTAKTEPDAEDAGAELPGPGDPEPGPETKDAGDQDAAESDAALPTGCPNGCLPPAPSGWSGPSAVYDGPPGDKPAACPSTGYTEPEIEAHQGLTGGDAACDCGSAKIVGAYCSATVVAWSTSDCTGNPATAAKLEGTAKSTSGGCLVTKSGQNRLHVGNPALHLGTCEYPEATMARPLPEMAKVDMACGLPQHHACEGRPECVAAPALEAPFTRVCVYKDGDVACPSEDYAERFVAYRGMSDTRACTACAGTPSGGTCGTRWGFVNDTLACSGVNPNAPTTYEANTSCAPGGAGAIVDVRAMHPTGVSCTASGGTPTGTLESADPVTFCCSK